MPTLRVASAGLLGAIAAMHLYLWSAQGYSHIPTIGPLFLLNGVAGSALGLTCLLIPRRLLSLAGASGALFALATFSALLLSLNVGLFGFNESTGAPLVGPTIAAELAEVLVGAALAALGAPDLDRRFFRRPGATASRQRG